MRSRGTRIQISRFRLACGAAALMLAVPLGGNAQLISYVTDISSDAPVLNGVTTQRENDLGYYAALPPVDPGIVVFGEDVPCFTDRTHEYNGPRFSSATGLLSTTGDTIGIMPPYLVGGEYVASLNTNRDNPAPFGINVTIGAQNVTAYLLIDNRNGNSGYTLPPALGSGGTGLLPWVADDGWVQVNTGLSPNGQPDFVAYDEGSSITDFSARPHATTPGGLAYGPGEGLNQFATVYRKDFSAGSVINLKEQATGNNMYGLVVVPNPRAAVCALLVSPSFTSAQGFAGNPNPAGSPITLTAYGDAGPVSYTAQEMIDATTPGNVSWISLSKTSPASPLAPGATDTVTVNYTISGLSPGAYAAYVQITSTCSPATTHLVRVNLTLLDATKLILSVTDSGSDGPITNGGIYSSQRENDQAGVVVPFGEEVFCYTDRTHQYKGAVFTAAGNLTFSTGDPAAGSIVAGLPTYLTVPGSEYVSTRNDNKDNTSFQMEVTLNQQDVTAYLLVDNRTGDNINTNPAVVGPASLGWMLSEGWRRMNTWDYPNRAQLPARNAQPDYVGIDEGGSIADFTLRATTPANLVPGPGKSVQNAYVIYRKEFLAGEVITLKSGSSFGGNMYGMVVTPRAACDLSIPTETLAVGLPDGTSPAPITHTIDNVGAANLPATYTVAECDANLNAYDWDWLTLDKAGGTVPGGGSDTLTLSFDATGLPAGRYTAYVKFVDSCGRTTVHTVTLAIGAITYVSIFNSDGAPGGIGPTAQRENDFANTVVYFTDYVFALIDRNHRYMGARFDAAGTLNNTGSVRPGLPSYLLGGEYVSTLQSNRDNATVQLNVTVASDVLAYLLIDNRVGDATATNTDPPTLGSGTTGALPWVANDGWLQLDTGLSPDRNGLRQPDFIGIDEGSTPANITLRGTGGLDTNPNQYSTVYRQAFTAGSTITLREQNAGNYNMYGLVVVPQVPCRLTVTPTATTATGIESGSKPANATVTITNTGVAGDPTSYTVTVLDENKVPATVGWLSIDKTAPAQPIPGGQSDALTLSFDTTGLSMGDYVAYLRLIDSCSPAKTMLHKITLAVQPPDLRLPQRMAPNGMYVERVGSMTWDEARVHYTANYQGNLPTFHGATGDWKPPTDRYVGTVIGSHADMWLPGTDADGVSSLDGVNLGTLLGTAEGIFKWLDGSAVPTGDVGSGGLWNTGEPNDYEAGVPGEDGMEIYAGGVWNDDGTGPTLGAQDATVQPYYLLYDNVDLTGQGTFKVFYRPGTTASLAEAITLLQGPAVVGDAQGRYYAISMGDPGAGGGGNGSGGGWRDWPKVPWPTDDPAVNTLDDDNFVSRSIGVLVIPEAGSYTFVVAHDDDCQFTIGTQLEIGGACDPSSPVCVQSQLAGATVHSVLVTFPAPGEYPIELIQREGTGSSYLQLFAARGDETTSFNRGYRQVFRLVGDVLGGGLAVKTPVDVCGAVFADRDGDSDVDQADFGQFQVCFSGSGFSAPAECACLDRDGENAAGDGDIDAVDLQAFMNCYTGPAIVWSQAFRPDCVAERP
ncbi:MAG TPA: hypothetical protein PKY77_10030 [Phycisphaerae bacterium]|nr:hypothetical protein [Phycisphaerae bacterium]HRY69915.1 hypothetical protein [Phycisphaerae bacterium]HSA27124.1 hypothetical protein [Phycisphaerae bacterium]